MIRFPRWERGQGYGMSYVSRYVEWATDPLNPMGPAQFRCYFCKQHLESNGSKCNNEGCQELIVLDGDEDDILKKMGIHDD